MFQRTVMAAGALAGALVWSSAAFASPGMATGDVHMRSGPGTQYPVITTIPAGAPVDVMGCQSWCHVAFDGREGYASGRYIANGYNAPRAYYYRPAPPPPVYFGNGYPWWHRHYHHHHWHGGPGFYFGFGG
jgi:uncharacterized protein YraI